MNLFINLFLNYLGWEGLYWRKRVSFYFWEYVFLGFVIENYVLGVLLLFLYLIVLGKTLNKLF